MDNLDDKLAQSHRTERPAKPNLKQWCVIENQLKKYYAIQDAKIRKGDFARGVAIGFLAGLLASLGLWWLLQEDAPTPTVAHAFPIFKEVTAQTDDSALSSQAIAEKAAEQEVGQQSLSPTPSTSSLPIRELTLNTQLTSIKNVSNKEGRVRISSLPDPAQQENHRSTKLAFVLPSAFYPVQQITSSYAAWDADQHFSQTTLTEV
ncbi:MAG: hypothetical protein AAFU03_03225, partial [Bacteroidota bacterium]